MKIPLTSEACSKEDIENKIRRLRALKTIAPIAPIVCLISVTCLFALGSVPESAEWKSVDLVRMGLIFAIASTIIITIANITFSSQHDDLRWVNENLLHDAIDAIQELKSINSEYVLPEYFRSIERQGRMMTCAEAKMLIKHFKESEAEAMQHEFFNLSLGREKTSCK